MSRQYTLKLSWDFSALAVRDTLANGCVSSMLPGFIHSCEHGYKKPGTLQRAYQGGDQAPRTAEIHTTGHRNKTSPTQDRASARMPFPKFSSAPRCRTQGPFPPSPLPEPPTLDRSRQVLREEEKEEMSLWERPRGPGKDQMGSGAVPLLPGLSAIVVVEPRRAGRREGQGRGGEGGDRESLQRKSRPSPPTAPPGRRAILGLWEHKFCVCTGAKRSG